MRKPPREDEKQKFANETIAMQEAVIALTAKRAAAYAEGFKGQGFSAEELDGGKILESCNLK